MQKGWKATGLLQPHWGRVGGRDGLARLTGIQPATISGYNTGRLNMTPQAASRIAAALDVTVYDLGAPADSEPSNPVDQIKATLDEFQVETARHLKSQSALLAALTAVGVELRGLIDDLREANAKAPRPSRKRRPA